MRKDFSVLLSVYAEENPEFLSEALRSMDAQTLLPSEIVIVKDGPLTSDLDKAIDRYSKTSEMPCKVVALKKNAGLGEALSVGMKQCAYDWIARMDSDDIALSDRFEKQIAYLEAHPKVDVLGGWICEFDDDPLSCTKERRPPCMHNDILHYAKYRNPLNHMTVVFRKEAVEKSDGYLPMKGFEDYYLWMRMLQNGNIFANLDEVTVKARAGNEMIRRRQGWSYAKAEWALEKAAWHMGFWSGSDLLKNLFLRILPRLLPVVMIEKLYNLLRKTER